MSAVLPKKAKKETAAPAKTKKKVVAAKLFALEPRVSEKGYALSEQSSTYVFNVPKDVNKFDIASAVASQFEVEVMKVRLAGVPGKSVRSYRQRGRRSINAKRTDVRKAYVTLKEGDKLPIYAAIEESKAPEEAK